MEGLKNRKKKSTSYQKVFLLKNCVLTSKFEGFDKNYVFSSNLQKKM